MAIDAYAQRLVDRRKNAEHRFNELLDRAVEENRDLTSEEETEKTRLIDEMRNLKKHADEIQAARDLSASNDALVRDLPPTDRDDHSTPKAERSVSSILAEMGNPNISTDELAVRSFTSERTMATMGLGWENRALRYAAGMETRAALTTSGGSAVPTTFADWVAVAQVTADPVYAISRKLPTRTGQPIVLPQVTAHPAISVTAEGSAIGTANPTIASITLYAFKFPVLCDFTYELERDNVIGLDQLLGESVGISAGTAMGEKFAIGTGTLEPTGFLVTASDGHTATKSASTATAFFDWADLISLKNSVPAPYRNRPTSAFMASNDAYTRIQSLRDLQGAPVWYASNTPGVADRFAGNPIYENPAMVAAGSAVSSAVAFGDFYQYVIREVTPMRTARSEEWQFGSDIVTLKTVFTVDGHLSVASAIKRLHCANS